MPIQRQSFLGGETVVSRNLGRTVWLFFAQQGRAGLILPDGWFGRPYDGGFRLKSTSDTGAALKIVFTYGEGSLTFTGGGLEAVESLNVLTLFGFDSLSWQWAEAGKPDVEWLTRFDRGSVQLVGPNGHPVESDRISHMPSTRVQPAETSSDQPGTAKSFSLVRMRRVGKRGFWQKSAFEVEVNTGPAGPTSRFIMKHPYGLLRDMIGWDEAALLEQRATKPWQGGNGPWVSAYTGVESYE